MREKNVVIAVVKDDLDRYLLFRNWRWRGGLAFPMKDVAADAPVLGRAAIRALETDLDRALPHSQAKALGHLGRFGQSGATGEDTVYNIWAFAVEPGEPLTLPLGDHGPSWEFYDDLLTREDVTWTTREVARALVESQEVALAVVTRLAAEQTQYLLVWNDAHGGFFFPCTRCIAETRPEAVARSVLRNDFGYRGELQSANRGAVEHFQNSRRVGCGRAYRFHVCEVTLPRLDLNQPHNALEREMRARGLRWRWVNAEELRKLDEPISKTLEAVRASVFGWAPPLQRERAIRQSEGGLALISREVDGHTEWLTQWNAGWGVLSFVGGHREGDESFRACVIREIGDELGLRAEVDYQVALMPRMPRSAARGRQPDCFRYVAQSRSAGEDTRYTMRLFDVKLSPTALARVSLQHDNAWLSAAAIRRREADDGRPISATVPVLLTLAGLVKE